ncbi:ACT domain-containing protein ACR9-like protein [Tanacetum coccineum]
MGFIRFSLVSKSYHSVSRSYGIPPTPARRALFIVYQSAVPYIAERIDPYIGYGPRVFFDVTLALKALRIYIFSAEIGRHSTSDRKWEVYRYNLGLTERFWRGNKKESSDISLPVLSCLLPFISKSKEAAADASRKELAERIYTPK